MATEEERRSQSPRSPEARLGMKVEDLWNVQQGFQLSPTEKLNAFFEGIPLSAFPASPSSHVVEVRSDDSLAEAVQSLSENTLMRQSDPPSPKTPGAGTAFALAANGAASAMGLNLGQEPASETPGSFFEALTSSQVYKNTRMLIHDRPGSISGSFRWAPFLVLRKEDSFLTMLLLLSKYKMKSVPVVDEGKIDNIITQSAVIHMLAECAGLHWCMKRELEGYPLLMLVVGSLRDICFLLTAPEIYHDFRSVTAKGFVTATRDYLEKQGGSTPSTNGMVTCNKDNTVKELILMLDFGDFFDRVLSKKAGLVPISSWHIRVQFGCALEVMYMLVICESVMNNHLRPSHINITSLGGWNRTRMVEDLTRTHLGSGVAGVESGSSLLDL
ncbi:hypothetical protein SAY87_006367 [Trapa incisa]|uniref:CBS domain-containing protein n=1 Tax=Trapa incisa TaxID=236973 RepID=A0AAN7JWF3_9MYRT|nr:hypothetical protein SAY87_006367 [Trapa incisa]